MLVGYEPVDEWSAHSSNFGDELENRGRPFEPPHDDDDDNGQGNNPAANNNHSDNGHGDDNFSSDNDFEEYDEDDEPLDDDGQLVEEEPDNFVPDNVQDEVMPTLVDNQDCGEKCEHVADNNDDEDVNYTYKKKKTTGDQ